MAGDKMFHKAILGSLDVHIVLAAEDPEDHSQSLELLQVLPGESDGVVLHGAHGLIQHLLLDLLHGLCITESHGGQII